ncbi:MAG: response regulator transcription factor [Bdellovibrionaceae bacterium]|nr:response regulator transcription factor [Pseudobdellovibrionaceae bacterium]
MNKVLIVDDEVLARKKIRRFLEEKNQGYEILEAENGLQAMEMIEAQKPNIVFLDIEMPEMNGMDLISALPSINFHLIFQTAYSEYAVSAFEKNAIDYLLKPYNQERFNQALEKCTHKPNQQLVTDIDHLKEDFAKKNIYLNKLVVKRGTKNTLINVEDVIYFRSENHYSYICTEHFEYIYNEPLKDLVNKLDPKVFRQVHRNAILNMNRIKEVIEGDNMSAVMTNGQKLQISRSNRKMVKDIVLRQ